MRTLLPLCLLLVAACGASPGEASQQPDFVTVEVSTVGMDMYTHSPVALLRDEETGDVLPILIGVAEAEAILRALHGVEMPRPMTHDLLASVLTELGAVLAEVRVLDVRDGTYYGALFVVRDGESEPREIDSRPSDALALALRAGAPIRVARAILQDPPEVDFQAPGGDAEVVRALGVSVVRPTAELREEFGLPDRDGVVVSAASDAAREAGVRRGDLVLDVDGAPVHDPMDFLAAARRGARLDAVRLRVWRGGETLEIELSPEVREPQRDRGPVITT